MSFVRTILGDLAPEELGLTYAHEHIVIDESYPTELHPDFLLDDEIRITEELLEFYTNGGQLTRLFIADIEEGVDRYGNGRGP